MAERESALEERQRQDREKAESIRRRQIRLGHIAPESVEEEEAPKPKARSRAKPKSS